VTAMTAVEPLIDSLDSDYSPDYWADHVKLQVARSLDQLDDAGWARLIAEWPHRPAGWRIRAADASSLSASPHAITLLTHMLAAPEPEVGHAIAEALLELDYQWSPEVSLRADLERHLRNASPAARPPLQRLLGRLPA
jgi:hypothetical protein